MSIVCHILSVSRAALCVIGNFRNVWKWGKFKTRSLRFLMFQLWFSPTDCSKLNMFSSLIENIVKKQNKEGTLLMTSKCCTWVEPCDEPNMLSQAGTLLQLQRKTTQQILAFLTLTCA